MDTFAGLQETALRLPPFPDGVAMADVLHLPPPWGQTLRRILRLRQIRLSELALLLQLPPDAAAEIGRLLVEKGALQVTTTAEEPTYKVRFAPKAKTQLADQVWNALGDL